MLHFWNALTTKLITDSGAGGLVPLTGHTVTDIRICCEEVPTKAALPRLVCCTASSKDITGSYSTGVKRTPVIFRCVATTIPLAAGIADRVEVLLLCKNQLEPRKFYDITDANIRNKITNFGWIGRPYHNKEYDGYVIEVRADFVWNEKN